MVVRAVVAPRRAIVVVADGLYGNGGRRRGQHGRRWERASRVIRAIGLVMGLMRVGVRIVVAVAVREGRGL